jgi:hypothetical protein
MGAQFTTKGSGKKTFQLAHSAANQFEIYVCGDYLPFWFRPEVFRCQKILDVPYNPGTSTSRSCSRLCISSSAHVVYALFSLNSA